MSQSDKHWVEELFPPNFTLTLNELLREKCPKSTDEDSQDKTTDTQKEDQETTPSVFRQLAHQQVSSLDLDKIKNVYERVWLMTRLEEEEKNKKRNEEDSDSEGDDTSHKLFAGGARKEGKAKKIRMRNAATSTSDINEVLALDVHDQSLWNSSEIEVLRSVFKATKEQNSRLQAELQESQHRNERLEAKLKTQTCAVESKTNRLKEATKANERLRILAKNLKHEVDEATAQISQLRAQVKMMQQQRSEMLKETHELRVAMDRERLDRKKVELTLQHHTQEAFREERTNQASLKALHDEDIQFLQKTIDDLTDELKKERKDHERTTRGLNHLRQHFSSLPVQLAPSEGHAVTEDELKQWTY